MTINELLKKSINENLTRMVFSKPTKDASSTKMKVRPLLIKGEVKFQVTKTVGSKESNTVKEIHENYSGEELYRFLETMIPGQFLQALIETRECGYTVLANKKGTITIRKNATVAVTEANLSHNQKKNYLLEENVPVPFLIDLGVMTKTGAIVHSKYDKFKQLNRYLEFIDDVMDALPKDHVPTIVDFGCGKSYLTFALYHYLVELKKMNVNIIGLDLKTDVIKECNRLKDRYGYKGLRFLEGDIEHYKGDTADMVISLHACDTATDYALFKGIVWNASVILAVPCCQHELNKKINTASLQGILQYGLLKDRFSAVATDAIRANILKEYGYDTQILEFIDMEHTPKNILIRAVKSEKVKSASSLEKGRTLEELMGEPLTLRRLVDTL